MTTTKMLRLQPQSLLLLLFIYTASAQTGGDCPATDAACRCDDDNIICEDLGQRLVVPAFNSSNRVFSTLSFQCNTRIMGIQSRAFAGLRVGTIDVSGSCLTSVDPAAFEDVDAAELRELILANNSLQDLPSTVFANLTSLRLLDLRNNFITRLSVGTFSDLRSTLTSLFLSDNRLTSGGLPSGTLSQLGNLTKLEIEDNLLTRWSSSMLAGSTKITELSLAGNRFTTFPSGAFKGLHELVKLRLGRNSIAMLVNGTFQLLTSLRELDLTGNQLSHINKNILEGLTSLESLNLSLNQLSYLSAGILSPLIGLRSLDLSCNLLRRLPNGLFVNNTILETINLSGNNLTITNGTFRGLTSLTKLFLSGNSICAISSSLFTNLTQLRVLDLSDNKIVDMEPGLLLFSRTLQSINLSANKISAIQQGVFQNGPALKRIDLSRNKIRTINQNTFDNLALRSIDLSHNEIDDVHENAFHHIAALSAVSLNHNRLAQVPSSLFFNIALLANVDLDYNVIENLTAKAFDWLFVVNISLTWNKISSIHQHAFAGLYGGTSIDLSGNSIEHIPDNTFNTNTNGLVTLSHLLLSHNRLTQVTNGTFAGLTGLTSLDLSNNHIDKVAASAFSALQSLRDLRLDGNNLETINYSSIGDIGTLRTLNLSSNGLSHQSLLAIEGLSGLTELYLDSNNLTSLKLLPNFIFLNTLSARNNSLFCIAYNRSTSITVLDLGQNRLRCYCTLVSGLKTFGNLTILKLDNNKLGVVPINAFSAFASRLEKLDLSGNDLNSTALVALLNLTNIRVLIVDDNQLQDISSLAAAPMSKVLRKFSAKRNRLNSTVFSVLSNFTELGKLFLDSNEIDIIPNRVFQGTYSVAALSLARNIILNIGSVALCGLQQTLNYLDLSNNKLSRVHNGTFSCLKNLEHLDLSDNNITLLTLPPNMPRLRVILLGGNKLRVFPVGLRQFLRISTFNVSHNSMVTLPSLIIFGNSKDRTILVDFQGNNLLNVGNLHLIGSFGRIDFSSNNLTGLAPSAMMRVKYAHELDLSNNKILVISSAIWHTAFTVTSLNMSMNNLILSLNNTLETEDKQCGTILTLLDLSNNSLRMFPSGQIASLSSSLAVFDIRNNFFVSLLQSDFSNMSKLTHLFLAGNPWVCDCSLVWLRQLENVFIDNATCLVPLNTSGHLVVCYEPPGSCPLDQATNNSRCQITMTPPITTTPATTSSRVQTSSEALDLTTVPSPSATNVTAPSTSVFESDISTSSTPRLPLSSTTLSPVRPTTTVEPVTPSTAANSTSTSATSAITSRTPRSTTASPTMLSNTTVSMTSRESPNITAVSNVTSTLITKLKTPGPPSLSTTTTPIPTTPSSTVSQPSANRTSPSGSVVTSRGTPRLPTRPSTTPGVRPTGRSTPGLNDSEPHAGPLMQVSSLDLNESDTILVAAVVGVATLLILAAILVGLVACLCWRSG